MPSLLSMFTVRVYVVVGTTLIALHNLPYMLQGNAQVIYVNRLAPRISSKLKEVGLRLYNSFHVSLLGDSAPLVI